MSTNLHHKNTLIHIVDDDEAVRLAMCLLMRSFGWRARAFASGEEFLGALPQEKPDCLVLDLNMPGMTGVELLDTLTAIHMDVPVIVVSGQGDSRLAKRALGAGAKTVLDKPIREKELIDAIERARAMH